MNHNIFKKIGRWVLVSIFLVIVGLQVLRLTSPNIPPPGQMVNVGDHSLHINCKGSETEFPTILFDAGATRSSIKGYHLQNAMQKVTRVCVYDRAGLGWSEPSRTGHTANDLSVQLHALIEGAGVKKPFVLAAHSIAGIYARSYHSKYPDDLAGMILLDSSHPAQDALIEELFGPDPDQEFIDFKAEVNQDKWKRLTGLTRVYDPEWTNTDLTGYSSQQINELAYVHNSIKNLDGMLNEAYAIYDTFEEGRALGNLNDLPLLVLTAYKPIMWPMLEGKTPEDFQELRQHLQGELAALSTNSKHIFVDEATHGSIIGDPVIVEKNSAHITAFLKSITIGE